MRLVFIFLASIAPLAAQFPDSMTDRYLTRIAEGQWAARKAAIARIKSPADLAARQEYIRKKLHGRSRRASREDAAQCPHHRLSRTQRLSGRQADLRKPAALLCHRKSLRAAGAGPFPAVLGTAGHSVDSKAEDLYQHTWISLARRGFLVLAYDPPGQGERIEYLDPATGKTRASGPTGEHTTAGLQCLLTGTNIARYFIWDGIRAVDYLLTRPDVDPKRIAVAGNSGGGTQSSYLAAFEPRLAAAAPSCYLTTWEKLWAGPGPQDAEQVFVNFLKDGLDFADFLIAFAPKPIHMAAAVRDYFPIDGARATYSEARALFQTAGAADHIGFFEFDDTHGWSKPRREATYRWFTRWLQNQSDDGIEEPDIKGRAGEKPARHADRTGVHFVPREPRPCNRSMPRWQKSCTPNAPAREGGISQRSCGPVWEPAAHGARRLRPSQAATPGGPGIAFARSNCSPNQASRFRSLPFCPKADRARKPAVLYVNAAGKAADAGRRRRPRRVDARGQRGARNRRARLGRIGPPAGSSQRIFEELSDGHARHARGQEPARNADGGHSARIRLRGIAPGCGPAAHQPRQPGRGRPARAFCRCSGAANLHRPMRDARPVLYGYRPHEDASGHRRDGGARRIDRFRSAGRNRGARSASDPAMKEERRAIGFRAHSGWAMAVVVGGSPAEPLIVERRRIETADPAIRGSKQPFHAAEPLPFVQAEALLLRCRKSSTSLADAAVSSIVRMHHVTAAGILCGSGRPLPALGRHPEIARPHPHGGRGNVPRSPDRRSRKVWCAADEGQRKRGLGVRSRALPNAELTRADRPPEETVGPPWSQDEKLAALAAWIALHIQSASPVS